MPPLVIPPLVKFAFAAAGGAVVIHWVVREARKINSEIANARLRARVKDDRLTKTLRRDPMTGEYRAR